MINVEEEEALITLIRSLYASNYPTVPHKNLQISCLNKSKQNNEER